MAVPVRLKGSKAIIELSPAEAQKRILEGEVELPEGRVQVRKGTETGTVPHTQIRSAILNGFQLTDDAGVARAKLEKDESDTVAQVAGTVEAAASGLTFGLAPWVEANVLGQDPERMRLRREAAGGAGEAAEVAGGIGSIALGYGLVGAGTRAGAAGAGRLIARGAVEGGLQGVGAEVDDSVLGERDLAAERLAAAGGYGALFGAGATALGAGVVAAGAGLGRVPTKATRAVLGKAADISDDVATGGAAKFLTDDRIAKAAKWTNSTPDDIRAAFGASTPEEARIFLARAEDAARVSEDAANSLRPPMEQLLKTRAAVRIEHGAMRHVESGLPKTKAALISAQEQGASFLAVQRTRLADELAAVDANMLPAALRPDLKRIGVMINQAESNIAFAAREGQNAKQLAATTYRELNSAKQGIFGLRRDYQRIAQSAAPTRESQEMLRILGRGEGDGVYGQFKQHLETPEIWHDLAARQKELNLAASEAIGLEDSLRGTASGRLLNPKTGEIDNADLLAVIKGSATFGGATKTERFIEALDARQRYFDVAKKHLELAPETRAAVQAWEASRKGVVSAMAAKRAAVHQQMVLDRLDGGFSSSLLSGAARSAASGVAGGLGAMAGGPLGALAGAAIARVLSSNVGSMRRLAMLNAKIIASESKYKLALGGFLRQLAQGTTAIERAARAGGTKLVKAAPVAGRLGAGRIQELDTAAEKARALMRNPGQLASEIQTLTAELEGTPKLQGVAALKATVATQYLASHAPTGYQAPYSRRPRLYDPVELARFERRLEAVREPYKALARLADGSFSAEHAEALQIVWPALYRTAQADILEALAEAEAAGKQIPLGVATRLGVFTQAQTTPFVPPPSLPQAAPQPKPQGGGRAVQPTEYGTQTQHIGLIT